MLSGMSNLTQVQANVVAANRSGAGPLAAEELALVGQVRDEYHRLTPIPCTDCKYCQPCPNGVNIPSIFALYNESVMFNAPDHGRFAYSHWMPEAERADQCLECGDCESQCPQKIEIIQWLPKVHAYLHAQ